MSDGEEEADEDDDITEKTVGQLVRSVEETKSYVFLIGAGTSRPDPAGIPTAGELIETWREECYDYEDPEMEFEEWCKQCEEENQIDQTDRYGFWFDRRHPTSGERRERIQELVEDATPTVGHVILASMMTDDEGQQYVPHTLTPNFDDLLYDAFYRYIGDRPHLVHHRAVAPEFKLTHDHPSIVKLHGDYLYSNLQNTEDETEALEGEMDEALRKTVGEYGLVVVGYGGNDESIMGTLLDAELSEYGIYWCTLDPDDLSGDAEKLLSRPDAHVVEIEGFQSLMLQFGRQISDVEPPTRDELLDRARERADQVEGILEESGSAASSVEEEEFLKTRLLQSDAIEALDNENYQNAIEICDEIVSTDPEYAPGYSVRGAARMRAGEPKKARRDFEQAISIGSGDSSPYNNYANLLRHEFDEYEAARNHYKTAIDIDPDDATAHQNLAEMEITLGNIDQARQVASDARAQSESPEYTAHSLMLSLIATTLAGETDPEAEDEYRELCEQAEFTTTWKFEVLDTWLADADLDAETEERITEYLDLLRAHKPDE